MRRFKSLYDWCLENNKEYILEEWNEKKNLLSVFDVSYASGKYPWWKCGLCGNEWQSRISNRTMLDRGCPICRAKQGIEKMKATVAQRDNLEANYPYLLEEWDYEKNEVMPKDLSGGSDYKAHWICSWCGNEWVTRVKHRTLRNSGCPRCKKVPTSFPEQAIAFYMGKVFKNVINRDNSYGFEVDIYIKDVNAAIEYDGSRWHKNIEKDNKKDILCENNQIDLIRIRHKDLGPTIKSKTIFLESETNTEYEKAIKEVFVLLNVPKKRIPSINIKKDTLAILENYKRVRKENSLAIKNPDLAKEWHPSKNGKLSPERIPWGFGKKVWWKCSVCGFEWEATPNGRTNKKSGCPVCARKRINKLHHIRIKNIDTGEVFDSLTEAALSVNGRKGDICDCCNGKQHTAFGYHWEYVDPEKRRRKVVKSKIMNIDTSQVFENSREAAKWCNGDPRTISRCCYGVTKTAYSYHWKFVDE